MDIKAQFLKTLKKYNMVKKGQKVVLGVSGGPDSICLLHLFMTFMKELDISLYAAHLDHMFRGQESEKDARFVEILCRKWDIPFFSDKINVPNYAKRFRLSPEDAARQVRYNFFKKVKKKTGAQKIATGHNQNDHEETILMNIFRGSGLDGIIGINPVRSHYIRPLIEIPRRAIEEYLVQLDIPFRTDATNLTPDYFRNSLRLELIPLIRKKYCPQLGPSLRRLAKIAGRDLSFMEFVTKKTATDIIRKNPNKVMIDVVKFSKQHEAIKYRLVRLAVKQLAGGIKDFEARHAKLLVDFIEEASSGSLIDLPKNLQGIKEYDYFILSKGNFDEIPDYSYVLKIPGKIDVKEVGVNIKAYVKPHNEQVISKTNPKTAYLDYSKIRSCLVIRNRRPGDRFKPLGSIGSKKLKDFFIDEKIPRRKRDCIPIVTSGAHIIWVGGMRINDEFRVTEKTDQILVLVMEYVRDN